MLAFFNLSMDKLFDFQLLYFLHGLLPTIENIVASGKDGEGGKDRRHQEHHPCEDLE